MTNQQIINLLAEPKANDLLDEKCPQCGVVLGAAALFGLCPNCLLKQGLGRSTEIADDLWPPSVKSLTEAMRGVFEAIEFIGRGGMGAVFRARQSSLNRIVALKIMPPRAADGLSISDRYHRFKREARLPARLSHRNVVGVHDFGLAGNFLYFTMDFVNGPSLRRRLRSGPLVPSDAVKLFLQLCDGLQHAHQSGVIHRDIKPENLLVDEGGVLKIADFGLAKLNAGVASNEWRTLDSRRMGTPHYMAPEQVERPREVDHRADIYSAGVVLYEMLTGGLPLGRFPRPSEEAEIDSSLDRVLFRALEKDLARRYQDIGEFKQAVEAVAFNEKVPLQNKLKSDLRHVPGHFPDQLAQWAEAVIQTLDLEYCHPLQGREQLPQWAEIVAARSCLPKAA